MTCNTCGSTTNCGCGPDPVQLPQPQRCNEIPAQSITCFSGQSLPPELPTEGIPASAISYDPPQGGCVPTAATVQEYLDKIAKLYFDLFCPVAIAGTQGNCSVLAVKNGKVLATTFQSLFDSCLACLKPNKICPGKDGDVLQTIGGEAAWGPLTVPAPTPIGCAEIKTALEGSNCIASGPIVTNLGFDAGGKIVKMPPPPGAAPLDCATLLPLLGSCPPLSTDPKPDFVIGIDGSGNAEKFGLCPTIKLAVGRSADSGCLPDAPALATPARMVGYNATAKDAEYYEPVPRYMAELRGTPGVDQTMSNVPQTLNNVTTFWGAGPQFERGLRGTPSWYDPATGRFTIRRAGFYRASLSGLYCRVWTQRSFPLGALGHVYAGITVVRAAGTIDGTAYPRMVGIIRGAEYPVEADGREKDMVFSGQYVGPLAVGDQVWIRIVASNVPENTFAFDPLIVKDDGLSHFTLTEEPGLTYMPI